VTSYIIHYIFVTKDGDVRRNRRKSRKEEHSNLFFSLSITNTINLKSVRGGRMRDERNAYRILVSKPHGKRPIQNLAEK